MKRTLLLMLVFALCCASALALPTVDREGNPLALTKAPKRVISLAPATTQVIELLGLMDAVIAVDTYTPVYVDGCENLPQFDMMAPDCEAMAALTPDLVFVTGMSYVEGGDPFAVLRELGVQVAVIPSSESLSGIADDIRFIADAMGQTDAGNAIADDMLMHIEEVRALSSTITEKKRVMFEVGALPYLYSFGSGTFLNEMIEVIGAQNVFADQEGWLSITEESAVAANPDVILTSVNYMDDPVGEIMSRAGWGEVTAIKNGDVYYIDNAQTSLPNQNVVDALITMAQLVYPEVWTSNENAA